MIYRGVHVKRSTKPVNAQHDHEKNGDHEGGFGDL
jgi:hypothetical protein